MTKQMARYTLNYFVNNRRIPLLDTTLKNIYSISTNFNDQNELIDFVKQYYKIDAAISKLSVTYNEDGQIKEVDLLYSDVKGITDTDNLIKRLNTYLSYSSNIRGLKLDNLQNEYLKKEMKELQAFGYAKEREFLNQLKIFIKKLSSSYKSLCDLALFIDEHKKEIGSSFFPVSSNNQTPDFNEISKMINEMNINDYNESNSKNRIATMPTNFSTMQPISRLSENEKAALIARIYDDEESRPPFGTATLLYDNEEKGKLK